jgi:hypothetical protein
MNHHLVIAIWPKHIVFLSSDGRHGSEPLLDQTEEEVIERIKALFPDQTFEINR